MIVEARDLINLRLRQAHILGERPQMRSRQTTVAILDQMQELDQQIPAPHAVAQKLPDLCQCDLVQRPPLGSAIPWPPFAHGHTASPGPADRRPVARSEEPTSELQSLMRNSYAVF